MVSIKPFFNRLFQSILLATSVPPPLFSDSGSFATSEFPRHSFPLEVKDWRDILVFLYTHGNAQTRQHADQYKVVNISRYAFKEAPEHQIIIAEVDTGKGPRKLLRIERDTGVKDVVLDPSIISAPALQDAHVPKPTTEVSVQKPSIGVEVSHPSVSIYAAGSRPGANAASSFVDTVQTTFESDVRNHTLVDNVKSSSFNLHHLAMLVVEVHSYTFQLLNQQEGRACALFAGIIMRVVADALGTGISTSVSPSAALEIGPEALKQIQAAYQGRRAALDLQVSAIECISFFV